MAWSKAKTAIVAGACVLLAAGTATIIIHDLGKPMRTIQPEWSVISGDNGQWSWAGGKIEGHSVTGDSIFGSSKQYGDVTFSASARTLNREASLAFRMQVLLMATSLILCRWAHRANPTASSASEEGLATTKPRSPPTRDQDWPRPANRQRSKSWPTVPPSRFF